LRSELAEPLPPIEADSTQIRQVVMNLITNASEACGDGSGVITISTGSAHVDRDFLTITFMDGSLPEGDYVFVEVSDTGCGMDAETQARLFDPFFTTKATGRGLGMAAVLGIVRGHRGAIQCQSQIGGGTTFKVLFPIASGVTESQTATRLPAKGIRSGTILVVDDEDGVRSVARLALERQGFKVLVAKDGIEGIEIYRLCQDEIAVVLLDMMMPRLNGDEVFRELRAIREDVRVILSSGYNEQEATTRFAGSQLAGFIQKPYRLVDLVELVNRVLGGEIVHSDPAHQWNA
jgi:CheY-like chemotaxis protein